MTAIAVDATQAPEVMRLCRLHLRQPENQGDPGATQRTFVFTPDLTTAEQSTFDVLVKIAGSREWTPDAYNAVRTQMQTLRDLRQMGRNAFMALSQAERDRLIYDNLVAATQVFLSILRD